MIPLPPQTVAILLALYNGEKHLMAQLQSYVSQSHKDWSLIISDDGSGDASLKIAHQFARRLPDKTITFQSGPKAGFVANFLSLLRAVGPDVPFAALSDQDDVWLEDKLKRAIRQLQEQPEGMPVIYCSRTIICTQDLVEIEPSRSITKPPSFANALVQNIAAGNTIVLNRAALDIVQPASLLASTAECHDWWIYQIITGAGGQVIYDPQPSVKYRQHAGNQIGSNAGAGAGFKRLRQMFNGTYQGWNAGNITALNNSRVSLTPEGRKALDAFARARKQGFWGRLKGLHTSGAYRQTTIGHWGLWVAAALGRL